MLIAGLIEAGRRAHAAEVLREQFRRCPAPEAIPALQTWWGRIELGEDVVEFARAVMLKAGATPLAADDEN